MAPASPKDKSLADIVTDLKGHFETKPLIIAERFHFHRQNQASSESIATYVAELRRLASKCEFKAYLEEALRDRLVCGLLCETIQRALLAEADLTLQQAIEVAQSMEAPHAQNCSITEGHRISSPQAGSV